ncbi:MAG: hypothetical protein ACKO66_10450 [Flavobacteriales bacterium]
MKSKSEEIADIKASIGRHIGMGDDSVQYQVEQNDGLCKLRLLTVNARHSQTFLFHTTEGETELECMRIMHDYVRGFKEEESSFTIQWTLRGESVLHTSYFRSKNILGALDKLYYDRDPNSIIVFSVMMNPIS